MKAEFTEDNSIKITPENIAEKIALESIFDKSAVCSKCSIPDLPLVIDLKGKHGGN